MIFEIVTRGGGSYYTQAGGFAEVLTAISTRTPLSCFWYRNDGHRFEENFVFPNEDEIVLVRTESPDEEATP